VTASGGREIVRQFISFVGVGTLGFAVDAALFFALQSIVGWPIAWARTVSATCSITTTWALNRRLTFAERSSPNRAGEYLRYVMGQIVGLGVNLGTFSLCLLLAPQLRRYPITALAIGAAAALLFNFFTARTIAFRAREHSETESEEPPPQ
jgi:putative flippase GtrA